MMIRESIEKENDLLRSHLSEKVNTIDQLNNQIDSLKQKLNSQSLLIESLKTSKDVDEPAKELKPLKFDKDLDKLPQFEPEIKISSLKPL